MPILLRLAKARCLTGYLYENIQFLVLSLDPISMIANLTTGMLNKFTGGVYLGEEAAS